MQRSEVRSLSGGANQRGLRDHNARLLLTLMQRHGPLPGSDLARLAGLSAQTVSVILRELDEAGMLTRGAPQRGRVGKPRVPVGLNPDGAFSVGLKVGRRSADLLIVDLHGRVRGQLHDTYRYPDPADIMRFLESGLAELVAGLPARLRDRIVGIGVARPGELWVWHETVGAPPAALDGWRGFDFAAEVARFSALPVHVDNDATAACRAEHVFGRGREFRDYAYFFVGSFIGGGIVLNHSVFGGAQNNAGAMGPIPTRDAAGRPAQLLDTASLHLLERRLVEAGHDPARLWSLPQDWSGLEPMVEPWLDSVAEELARAVVAVCAVIDFEAVLFDGGFPEPVRAALVERVRDAMGRIDLRGLIPPRIEAGTVGGNARGLGAASAPIFAQFLLDTHAGFAAT
ncbi:ROK family transcriptional regulator [Limimaricola pyoseonensis]|uniref:Sugar kinase of the NBD/HSP70 family, may contain an N-terminal HTH domain n=1 Tax=Limimaricola pyoseonensis TaxID=521013 RepID=A0A1G6ZM77_9RHOB|nr:ROK family transcriptional regulator [Limimaricola pyoseonensis]SDE02905.1 Sugar kinase of the NBD/HSP70 family, may contain an N-terminal HTH domain [Limimaricola pyoseonensis]